MNNRQIDSIKSGDAAAMRRRYVSVFTNFVEQHPKPIKPDLDALESEKDNIIQAISYAAEAADWEAVIRVVRVLGQQPGGLFDARGYWTDALPCYDQGLRAARALNRQDAAGYFAFAAALINKKRGRFRAAEENIEAAYEALKDVNEPTARREFTDVAHELAMMALDQGDLPKSERLHRENLILRKRLKYWRGVSHSTHELGRIKRLQGDFVAAAALLQESLRLRESFVEDPGAVMPTLHDLGCAELDQGIRLYQFKGFRRAQPHYRAAEDYFQRSLAVKRLVGNRPAISNTLYELARLAGYRRRFERAEEYFDECLEIRRELGDSFGVNQARIAQAEIAVEQAKIVAKGGELAAAETLLSKAEGVLRRSMKIKRNQGVWADYTDCLYLLGLIAEHRGDAKKARRFFQQASDNWQVKGFWYWEIAQYYLEKLRNGKESHR